MNELSDKPYFTLKDLKKRCSLGEYYSIALKVAPKEWPVESPLFVTENMINDLCEAALLIILDVCHNAAGTYEDFKNYCVSTGCNLYFSDPLLRQAREMADLSLKGGCSYEAFEKCNAEAIARRNEIDNEIERGKKSEIRRLFGVGI